MKYGKPQTEEYTPMTGIQNTCEKFLINLPDMLPTNSHNNDDGEKLLLDPTLVNEKARQQKPPANQILPCWIGLKRSKAAS